MPKPPKPGPPSRRPKGPPRPAAAAARARKPAPKTRAKAEASDAAGHRPAIARRKDKPAAKPTRGVPRKDPRTKTTGPTPRRSPVRPLPTSTAEDSTRPLALAAVGAALDKKGEDPVLLDVRELSSYADYVLLLSADSERQVEALARAIEEKLRELGTRLRSSEAAGESNWLLLDFGDLVIHVFYRDARGFYDLEGLWSDAPRVPLGQLIAGAFSAPR